ncbi:hypothetical protein BGZ83_002474 [Gryganskiella cystojenkinii]|nr:hypothetical protein BGZ83_002474 [Gryganskiella cystojenkinii]
MPSPALGHTLARTTRVSVPRLATPIAAGSSRLLRLMSSWGESESSSSSFTSSPSSSSSSSSHWTPDTGSNGTKPKKAPVHNYSNHRENKDFVKIKTREDKNGTSNNYTNGYAFIRPEDPSLYRVFFRSPDKLASLEEAQVFINHIRSTYGPLTQYQFARCPETKRYFGYGFLTFKHQESIEKAVTDGYIRVGLKDFELKRTGYLPFRRTIRFPNTGFSGFYDIEDLRAKAKAEQQAAAENAHVEQGESHNSIAVDRTQETTKAKETEFVSAFSPGTIKPSATIAKDQGANELEETTNRQSTSSKPVLKPLQSKGPAQIWKTIPAEIERAEKSARSLGDEEELDGDTTMAIPPARVQ